MSSLRVQYFNNLKRGVGPDVVIIKSTEDTQSSRFMIVGVPLLKLAYVKMFVQKLNGDLVPIVSDQDRIDLVTGKFYEGAGAKL